MGIGVEWILDLNLDNQITHYDQVSLLKRDEETGDEYLTVFMAKIPPSAAVIGEDRFIHRYVPAGEFRARAGNVISFAERQQNNNWTQEPWVNPDDKDGTWIRCLMNGVCVLVAKHCPDGTDEGALYYKILLEDTPLYLEDWTRLPEDDFDDDNADDDNADDDNALPPWKSDEDDADMYDD